MNLNRGILGVYEYFGFVVYMMIVIPLTNVLGFIVRLVVGKSPRSKTTTFTDEQEVSIGSVTASIVFGEASALILILTGYIDWNGSEPGNGTLFELVLTALVMYGPVFSCGFFILWAALNALREKLK